MRRVVFNQKGGVGKSTITCNLAAVSAAKGKRTLVIDLDPQANASQYLLGAGEARNRDGAAEFFGQVLNFSLFSKSTDAFVHPTRFENLAILPARRDLEALQSKLEARFKIYKLREALDRLEGFEHIYIDTPPALNFFSLSALIAAERCLIPFDCDDFSRQALYRLLESVAEIKADHNPALAIEGIVVNQFQPRANLPQRVVEELEGEQLPVLKTRLSSSIKIRESHEAAAPMVFFDPKHKLAEEFVALHDELHGVLRH